MAVTVAAVAAQGPHSPAFRIRTQLPASALAGHGIAIEPLPLFDARQERAFVRAGPGRRVALVVAARRRLASELDATLADRTVIQRQADILPLLSLERRAARGRRFILDVDDAVWLDASQEAGGHRLARLKRTAHKVRWLARRADHVVAGNEHLAAWLAPYARELTVVPSLVDTATAAERRHEDSGAVLLGWIGSRTTQRYLQALAPLLARTGARLEAVGAELDPVDGLDMRCVPWSEAAERSLLGRMDIGLMPLPDDPWTRGKCAYKALQYMSVGVPVVADDVGVTAVVVGDRDGGLIVSGRGEWTEAITALAADAALRARLGAQGRRRVAADFSLERWAPVLASILRGT